MKMWIQKRSSRDKLKTLVLLAVAVVVVIVSAMGVYAYFSDILKKDANTITAGTVCIELYEKEPFDKAEKDMPETGEAIGSKEFWGKSTGIDDCYVRAKIRTTVEASINGEWVVIPVADDMVKYHIVDAADASHTAPSTHWQQGADGYYYYDALLKSEETTSHAMICLTNVEIPEEYRNIEVRYTINVTLEAAQAANDQWQHVWDITELPPQ